MKSPLLPTENRIICERIKPAEKKGVIIVPEQAKEPPTCGKVVAVGRTAKEVREGYLVLFGKYAGVEIEINGRKLVTLREDEVIAIVCDAKVADGLYLEGL